jgi:hypothetical protein
MSLRELAAAATPGPWAVREAGIISQEFTKSDVRLVALAPELAELVADMADALGAYADARHWALEKFDAQHPALIWIGPGAEKRPLPDAAESARALLARFAALEKLA